MNWVIALTEADLLSAQDVTTKRQQCKADYNVATKKYDVTRDDWQIAYTGFLGEIGLARVLGIEPDWTVMAGGDPGYDLRLGTNTIQVKTPHSDATKNWFYMNSLDLFTADIGVLCNLVGDNAVLIRGAIDRASFLNKHVNRNWGYGSRVGVHASNLKSINNLIEAVQSGAGFKAGKSCSPIE